MRLLGYHASQLGTWCLAGDLHEPQPRIERAARNVVKLSMTYRRRSPSRTPRDGTIQSTSTHLRRGQVSDRTPNNSVRKQFEIKPEVNAPFDVASQSARNASGHCLS